MGLEAVLTMTHFWDDLWGQTFLGIGGSERAIHCFIGSTFLIPRSIQTKAE